MAIAHSDSELLQEYASFLLKHHLEEAVQDFIHLIKMNELPLFKFYAHLSDAEFKAIIKPNVETFLGHMAEGTSLEGAKEAVAKWKVNNLPHMAREEVQISDMVKVYSVRKQLFAQMLPLYTQEVSKAVSILAAIERAYIDMHEVAYQAYSEIWQDDMRQQQEQVLREKYFSELLLNSIGDAIIAYDKDQRITTWNKEIEDREGIPAKEAIGRYIFDMYPQFKDSEWQNYITDILSGKKVTIKEKSYVRKQGFYSLTMVPVFDQGQVVGGITIIRDITETKTAEQEVEFTRDFYISMLEDFPALIWLSGTDANCYYFNKTWLDFTGRTIDQEQSHGWTEGVHPDDVDRCLTTYTESFRARNAFTMEYRLKRYDGEYRWIMDFGKPLYNADGTFSGYLGACYDITEQRDAAERLAENQNFIQKMADTTPGLLYVYNLLTQKYIYINHNVKEVLGYEPEVLLNAPGTFMEMGNEDSLQSMREQLDRMAAAKDGEIYTTENRVKHKDKGWRWIRASETVFKRDEDGNVLLIAGNALDVTELKANQVEIERQRQELQEAYNQLKAKEEELKSLNKELDKRVKERTEELQASNERFYTISKVTNDILWDWNPKTDHTLWSENFYIVLGYKQTGNEPGAWSDYIYEDDKERVLTSLASTLAGTESQWAAEYRMKKADGTYASVYDRGYILRDEAGVPYRMLGSIIDFTELHAVEKALNHQNKITKLITDNATAALFMMNDAGRCTFMNPAAEAMLGYTLDEIKDMPLHDAIHHKHPDGSHYPIEECPIDRALPQDNSIRAHEDIFIRKDGTFFPVLCAAMPIKESGEAVGTVIEVRDLTEEKRAQQGLLEITQRLRFVTESMPQKVWTADANGEVDYFNQRWLKYTDLTFEELKGWGWKEVVHPDDRERNIKEWQEAIDTGKDFQIEHRLRRADGEYRWHLSRGIAHTDSEGNITMWIGTNTDTHDIKMALDNLERTREELAQTNEELKRINTDLDNFVYTASHDLKAPVLNLEGLSLRLEKQLGSKMTEMESIIFHMIKSSVDKLKTTIVDLTKITQVQKEMEDDPELLQFDELLEDIKSDIQMLILESGAEIKADFKVPALQYTRRNLRSVLYNLLSNAIKYRAADRLPTIEVRTFIEGDYVVLCVSDNGLGIEEHQVKKIFNMFYRLHTHVDGSGIGLYIIKKIVENKGGHIEVESVPDKGTNFKVYFKKAGVSMPVAHLSSL
jgi:PAS domain S-box-containing protein